MAGRFWRLAEELERNKAAITELRQELRDMGRVVDWLVPEARHSKESEARERENLALRLQNELLRFERRLPPAKGKSSQP